MRIIENQNFSSERALYASTGVMLKGCTFEGEEDGESALKESKDIEINNCIFSLRYPFWHDVNVRISSSDFKDSARAPLWYTKNIEINNTTLLSPKALRECEYIKINSSQIESGEFGWSCHKIKVSDSSLTGEYFMLRASDIAFLNSTFCGKYSFQYIENAHFENATLDTKDAFWHAKNVYVKNSTIKGEYLGWYCENVTFENCTIIGTQPLCYCRGIKLINCKMYNCDLSFEKSEVYAEITTPVISIKNPTSGKICLPSVEEIIKDDPNSRCEILLSEKRELALK